MLFAKIPVINHFNLMEVHEVSNDVTKLKMAGACIINSLFMFIVYLC